jgi:hypothetical protein
VFFRAPCKLFILKLLASIPYCIAKTNYTAAAIGGFCVIGRCFNAWLSGCVVCSDIDTCGHSALFPSRSIVLVDRGDECIFYIFNYFR